MHERIQQTLQSMRPALRVRWEALLRQAPVHSPLAAPDVLVHLMNWTLEEFFKTLTAAPNRRRVRPRGATSVTMANYCPCGSNPLQTYFSCLKQTLAEAVENINRTALCANAIEGDILAAESEIAFALVSNRELETFCSVCRHSHATTEATVSSGTEKIALSSRSS